MPRLLSLNDILRKKSLRSNLPKSRIQTKAKLAPTYSLKNYCSTPYDQALLGSCTANAICGLIKMIDPQFSPSRLFIYTCELIQENPGQPIQDNGADAADGCMLLSTKGVCKESLMPYLTDSQGNVINFGEKPSSDAYADALNHIYKGFTDITVSLKDVNQSWKDYF